MPARRQAALKYLSELSKNLDFVWTTYRNYFLVTLVSLIGSVFVTGRFSRYPLFISQICALTLSVYTLVMLGPLPKRAFNLPLLISIIIIKATSVIMCAIGIASTYMELGKLYYLSIVIVTLLVFIEFPMFLFLLKNVKIWCNGVTEAARVIDAVSVCTIAFPDQTYQRDFLPPYENAPAYELKDYIMKDNNSDELSDVMSTITRISMCSRRNTLTEVAVV